jgi:hypothetical protein
VADVFPRHQTSGGFVTLGDTDADVLVFSGVPERVEVWVELNDAIVTFEGLLTKEEAEITLRAGQFYEPAIPCRRVVARNATAGLNARIQVVGKWAQPSS